MEGGKELIAGPVPARDRSGESVPFHGGRGPSLALNLLAPFVCVENYRSLHQSMGVVARGQRRAGRETNGFGRNTVVPDEAVLGRGVPAV